MKRLRPAIVVLITACVVNLTLAKNPPAGNADTAKAEAGATMTLAGIKLGRLALAEDGGLANDKDTVGGIYDREEAAVKDGINRLKAAGGDKAKIADGIAALNAATGESTRYFQANAAVKDKIAKRVTIIRAELGQIAKSPDAYVATLSKCGLAGSPLAQAKSVVKDASQKAAGQTDDDGIHSARSHVRKMLSAQQAQALDANLSGK